MQANRYWLVVAMIAMLSGLVAGCNTVQRASSAVNQVVAQIADNAPWVGAEELVKHEILRGRIMPEPGESDQYGLSSNARRSEVVALVSRSNNLLATDLNRLGKRFEKMNMYINALLAGLMVAFIVLAWLTWPGNRRRLKSVVQPLPIPTRTQNLRRHRQ